ncbi:MAG: FkbM family methyltransferase [Pseudomonadota bacterium]
MTPQDKIASARKLLAEARDTLGATLRDDRSRRRGPVMRELHNLAQMLDPAPRYFSQAGQDRVVDRILGAKTGGIFADIGGYDGVTGSNTLFFELFRGWQGVLVEPSPTQLRVAEGVRRCPALPYAVAGREGTLDFMEVTAGFTQMSGFLDSYDADLLARVRGDPRHQEVIHTLETRTLGSILDEAGLTKVDFLSLDVEGGEMDILTNFDFDRYEVDIWSIENNTSDPALPDLMQARGYDLVEFAGVDDIFRKRRAP